MQTEPTSFPSEPSKPETTDAIGETVDSEVDMALTQLGQILADIANNSTRRNPVGDKGHPEEEFPWHVVLKRPERPQM